ncbi:Deoxycytidine monophosphate (dCMP) deaminase [Nowakowskiella sp. JEL0407]|nr:Deoxycytidine monophosphate (dCMP) deaminase [Nowakowskiella sp. JEL0407]
MFIGIAGLIATGKNSIAEYLVKYHSFTRIHIDPTLKEDYSTLNDLQALSIQPNPKQLNFRTSEEAHNYVLKHWRQDFVLTHIVDWDLLRLLHKRPWFLLVTVEAPLSLRFKRYEKRQVEQPTQTRKLTFSEFVDLDEKLLYSSPNVTDSQSAGLYRILAETDCRILNSSNSLEDLFKHLNQIDLTHIDRTRPVWDSYFIELCDLAARRSNCMKRRVGAVLVKDRRIIATGYNGTPRGVRNCNEGGCGRCNLGTSCGEKLDTCLCLHAEENAILEAGRERIDAGKPTILYCNTCPCLGCAKKIVQAGVHEVVYALDYGMDELTSSLFQEAGVILRKHTNLQKTFVIN